jgi:HNH endonuclease
LSRLYSPVAGRAGHRCEICRAPEAIFNLPFEVEHIVPTSQHGSDDESNRALACRGCNLFKSNLLSGPDDDVGEIVRLFHPRVDRWEDHFRVEHASGTIVGLTPSGRATITVLKMNRPHQVEARRQWMLLGLFP